MVGYSLIQLVKPFRLPQVHHDTSKKKLISKLFFEGMFLTFIFRKSHIYPLFNLEMHPRHRICPNKGFMNPKKHFFQNKEIPIAISPNHTVSLTFSYIHIYI